MMRKIMPIKRTFSYKQGGWKNSGAMRLLLFVLFGILLYLLLASKLVPETYDIVQNTVAESNIPAPQQLALEKETQKARDDAAAKISPEYRTISLKSEVLINNLYEKVIENNTNASLAQELKISLYKDVFPAVMNDFIRQTVTDMGRNSLYSSKFQTEAETKLKEQIYKLPEESYYKLPLLTREDLFAMQPVTVEIVNKLMNEQIRDAATARSKVTELVNSSILTKNTQREMAQEIARFAITPNSFYDEEATDKARAEAREETLPVYINKGELVVAKGQMITEEIYERLQKLDLLKDTRNRWPEVGLWLLVALIMVGFYIYMEQNGAITSGNNAQLFMLGVIMTVNFLVMKFVALGQSLDYPFFGFLAPVSLGTMLLVLLMNVRLGFLAAVLTSVVSSVIFNSQPEFLFDYRYGFLSLVMCFTAVHSLHKASQRSSILKAGIMVSLFGLVGMLILFLLDSHYTVKDIAFASGFTIAGGLLTAIFVVGLMPFFETAFGILSPLKLVELSNPNHPLLRKLLTETPGTYHHSIMVGNLSEAAAEAVQADGLLCRVGSYYHDIGKTKRPSYFIENQLNIENPHDSIAPSLSKSIIVAHARDGVEMLKEHKMPKQIRDIAEQHHGTTFLKYFYHKAKQQAGEAEAHKITEDDYRYPGPKAQSKEAAIVGIADSVEAAVRSLRNPTIEQIDSLVQKIIKDRLDDGQFNECDLTLKELDTVAKALKETLLGIFHSRIEYPSDLPKNQENKG
ncbi:MAG: receptor with intracellular metal dependent phosphohydrolase [Paenibacillaceae bacterium]|jgi:putative nucleotidyltransferase with HDIG domain|nr:receptor with intracellular metal dependent phosphohydrolase [Paenibacillaceae bacterium]